MTVSSKPAPGAPVALAAPPNIGDVYYALFRHKWKVLVLSAGGLLTAGGLLLFSPPDYVSEAKLLVRYIRDWRAADVALGSQTLVESPAERGQNIIDSELEILTSRDIVTQVVDAVGPQKVLEKRRGRKDRGAATAFILDRLRVEVPRRSGVIRVTFTHYDPELAQTVLHQLVQAYLRKHFEVHRLSAPFDEFVTRKTDELQAAINQTEDDLRTLKLKASVTSLDDARRVAVEQVARLRQEVMNAEAELAQHRVVVERLRAASAQAKGGDTNAPAALEPPIDAEKAQHYRFVCDRLESLRSREVGLLLQFTGERAEVKMVREQMAVTEEIKRQLEAQEPRLRESLVRQPGAVPAVVNAPYGGHYAYATDLTTEEAQIAALEAKIAVFTNRLSWARSEITNVNEVEPRILELERRRDLAQANFSYFSASKEQTQIDAALGSASASNINVVEGATVAGRETRGIMRRAGLALALGISLGIGLALALEFGLDQTVRRPVDVEHKLRAHLFLAIPPLPRTGLEAKAAAAFGVPSAAPPAEYHAALGDKLVMYFCDRARGEGTNLVGVAPLGTPAARGRVAEGLARALALTNRSDILLVRVPEPGIADASELPGVGAHCGLAEAFAGETRAAARVQEHLYVVNVPASSNAKEGRPADGNSRGEVEAAVLGMSVQGFASLVPRMKASGYAFVILDLPGVTQTSMTAKVSGFLDLVLLVIESERTNLELAKRGMALLAESHAKVGIVLSEYRHYLPGRLRVDL